MLACFQTRPLKTPTKWYETGDRGKEPWKTGIHNQMEAIPENLVADAAVPHLPAPRTRLDQKTP